MTKGGKPATTTTTAKINDSLADISKLNPEKAQGDQGKGNSTENAPKK